MYEFILYKKGEMVSLVDRNLISLKLMSECDPEEFKDMIDVTTMMMTLIR